MSPIPLPAPARIGGVSQNQSLIWEKASWSKKKTTCLLRQTCFWPIFSVVRNKKKRTNEGNQKSKRAHRRKFSLFLKSSTLGIWDCALVFGKNNVSDSGWMFLERKVLRINDVMVLEVFCAFSCFCSFLTQWFESSGTFNQLMAQVRHGQGLLPGQQRFHQVSTSGCWTENDWRRVISVCESCEDVEQRKTDRQNNKQNLRRRCLGFTHNRRRPCHYI